MRPQGRHHVVVLFATFAGSPYEDGPLPRFSEDLFDPELEGSFSHFFREMSGGKLEVEGDVIPKVYSSEGPAEDYISREPDREGRYGEFNREVLREVDREVDFGLYDNDGPDGVPNSGDDDGFVDFLFVNVLGAPEEGFLYRKATGIGSLGLDDPFVTDDPGGPYGHILIGRGSTQRVWAFSQAVGVMAHEYGHFLGLEDLYDTSFLIRPHQPPEEDGAGIGSWGLMGWGGTGWRGDDAPASMCAWSLEKLGWAEVLTITHDTTVTFEPVRLSRKIYKIPMTEDEYFLVEYRRARDSYYDRNIPADGLLIWHIDLTGNNGNEFHKLVDLECADGLYDDRGYPGGEVPDPEGGMDNLDFWSHDEVYRRAHSGNRGDATDVYDGVKFREFSAFTNPSSNGYYLEDTKAFQRVSTGMAIRNIRREGEDMAAEVFVRHWSGPIVGDVVWSGEVRVFGDVWIEPKGSITLLPGAHISFRPGDEVGGGKEPGRSEIRVLGVMRTKERRWYGAPSVTIGDEDTSWTGIVVEGKGILDLSNVSIRGARWGVRGRGGSGRVRLSWSTLSGNEKAMEVEDWEGRVELSGCSVRRNGGGLHLDAKEVFVENTASYLNEGIGFSISADFLVFRSSGAVENGGGLRLEGCVEARILGSTFRNNAGVGLEVTGGKVEASDLEIEGNGGGGMMAEDAEISLKGFRFSSNQGFGLRAVRCSGEVVDGKFSGEDIAMWCTSSPMEVHKVVFKGNELALICDDVPLPLLSFNSFLGNVLGARNISSDVLDLRNNWWGTRSAPEVSAKLEGPVEWSPFLTSDPMRQIRVRFGEAFPNPSSGEMSFPFQIPWAAGGGCRVRITVWDIWGRMVKVLEDRTFGPGYHIVRWDGRDEGGRKVASGRYVVEFVTYGPEGFVRFRSGSVLFLVR